MEKRRKLLYSDLEGNVRDIMTYIRQLEKERDDALRQVEEWNEDDAVFEARRAQEEAEDWANECMSVINEGFAPAPSQWNDIRSWEENHEREHHHMSAPEDMKEMTKYIPNSPKYRYEFMRLSPLDGKCGCVTCMTCARKALRRSFGIEWLYDMLCEKYDVRHKIEEFI